MGAKNKMIRILLTVAVMLFSTVSHAQRITLASHQPIMTTGQPSKSTLYIDCWKHHNNDGLTYFDGISDVNIPIPNCEIGITLQASGGGALNANDVFDVVFTASGACAVTNGAGGGWSADRGTLTKRGTGYSAIDDQVTRGYPTNANIISHCYNGLTDYGPVAANQAALVGSICTDAAAPGKVSYIRGSGAAGGGAARLCVWSVDDDGMTTEVIDNGPNWTFLGYTIGGAIIDSENLDTATGGGIGNRVTFLSGLARHSPVANLLGSFGTSAAYSAYCSIGLSMDHGGAGDSPDRLAEFLGPSATLYPPGTSAVVPLVAADGVLWQSANTGVHQWEPVIGMHYIQAIETTDGVQRCWFRPVGGQRQGLMFQFVM